MPERVLVTGATGFIGRALVPFLLKSGLTVSILLREGYAQPRFQPLPLSLAAVRAQIDIVYADLRNFRLTRRALQQAAPTIILHLAAAGVTDPFLNVNTAVRHNVTGTLNLILAAFETNQPVSRFVVARTPGERTNMNVYAASKAAAWNFCDMYAQSRHWPLVGAMIFQAYGPGQPTQNLIPAALAAASAGQDFPMTSGTQTKDWIFISDIVGGLQKLTRTVLPPGTTVDLGSGTATPVQAVVAQIYELVNQGGRPLMGALPDRPGESAVQVADAVQSADLLGWQAEVPLKEGLRLVIEADKP